MVIDERVARLVPEYAGRSVKHRRIAVRIPEALWSRVKTLLFPDGPHNISSLIGVALTRYADERDIPLAHPEPSFIMNGHTSLPKTDPWEDQEDEVEVVPEPAPAPPQEPEKPAEKPAPDRTPHKPRNPKERKNGAVKLPKKKVKTAKKTAKVKKEAKK